MIDDPSLERDVGKAFMFIGGLAAGMAGLICIAFVVVVCLR